MRMRMMSEGTMLFTTSLSSCGCGTVGGYPLEPESHVETEPEASTHADPSTAAVAQVCINITHIRSKVVIYYL